MIGAAISLAINPLMSLNLSHYDYALMGFYTSFDSLFMPFLSLMFGSYYSRKYYILKSDSERDLLGTNLISMQLAFNFFQILIILFFYEMYARLNNLQFPIYPYAIITAMTIVLSSINDFYLLKQK